MRTRTTIPLAATACLAAILGLAGCSPTSSSSSPTPSTSQPSPSASPTAPTTPGPTAGTGTGTGGTGTGSGGGNGGVAACTSANLTAAIAQGSGGAAGSVYVTLVVTNKGSSACTLQGWPGVSLVGGGNGTQIGTAAAFDRSTAHPTVTLAKSGGTAKATLKYVQAGNYDPANCQPEKGDGFRVYPPGQKASIFAAYPSVTGCKSTKVTLFTVGAFS